MRRKIFTRTAIFFFFNFPSFIHKTTTSSMTTIIISLVFFVFVLVLGIYLRRRGKKIKTEDGKPIAGISFLSSFFLPFKKENFWILLNNQSKKYGDIWQTYFLYVFFFFLSFGLCLDLPRRHFFKIFRSSIVHQSLHKLWRP